MKVYLIETSHGSYEDYHAYIEIWFFNKDKAQEYIDKYNEDLEKRKLQSEECGDCTNGKYDYLSKILRNCKLCAKKTDISEISNIDGDLYFECDKSIDDYDICEQHPARIKEVDVVE